MMVCRTAFDGLVMTGAGEYELGEIIALSSETLRFQAPACNGPRLYT